MQARWRLRTSMRPIPRTLQIPTLPVDGLGQSGIKTDPVHAVRHLYWRGERVAGLSFPQIPVENAFRQVTRGWCISNSNKRTYIVLVGISSRRLIQKIHHRLPIRRIEPPGVVVLLVRRDVAVDGVRRDKVDGIADDLGRLFAVVEAREYVSRCLLGRGGEIGLH